MAALLRFVGRWIQFYFNHHLFPRLIHSHPANNAVIARRRRSCSSSSRFDSIRSFLFLCHKHDPTAIAALFVVAGPRSVSVEPPVFDNDDCRSSSPRKKEKRIKEMQKKPPDGSALCCRPCCWWTARRNSRQFDTPAAAPPTTTMKHQSCYFTSGLEDVAHNRPCNHVVAGRRKQQL
jgi:hypothetical protein